MLALSRKKDEAIVINDDIEIKIIEIKGDQVIQEANKAGANSVDADTL